jgi:tetratricopeptide (TPR) repeat protein
MKTLYATLLVLSVWCLPHQAFAQLDIPQKSPKANVSFRVGLTDVSIQYSSPAVRGRGIWGKLVPYSKVWRAGANEATTVAFSTSVNIGGKQLPKGKYSLFLIPEKDGDWTVIFNRVWEQWGAYQYDQTKDELRAYVTAKNLGEVVEHLRYRITEKSVEEGVIIMEWERKQVIIPFATDAINLTIKNVNDALAICSDDDRWWIHVQAAEFLLENNSYLDKAINHANQSIQLNPCVRNYWAKAQLLAQKQDIPGALAAADKAKSVSSKSDSEKKYYASVKAEMDAATQQWKKQKK